MTRSPLPSLALLVPLLLSSTTPVLAGQKCKAAAPLTLDEMSAPGPYAVSQRTVTLVDESRPTMANGDYTGAPTRTLVTELWYPSSANGAVLDGPFPVVVHSHGYLDNRKGEAYLTEHLASHGYVVAATDYPLSFSGAPGGPTVLDVINQPGDWSFVLDAVLAMGNDTADPLHGLVDGEHVAATGLSLGGLTTLLVTYHAEVRDPRIDAATSLAGLACPFTPKFYKTTKTPVLLVHGDDDLLVSWKDNARKAFKSGTNRVLMTLRDGSHTGFSGYATAFDQSQHHDRIGCTAINAALGEGDVELFTGLGTKAIGISQDTDACGQPCDGSIPMVEPPMNATRQHTLTKAGVLAFLEGKLRSDVAASCFLKKTLAADDVTLRTKGKL